MRLPLSAEEGPRLRGDLPKPPGQSGGPESGARGAPPPCRAAWLTGPVRRSPGTHPSPRRPEGPLCFYKSRFIYSPGPAALPGIYRFLSDRVPEGKCQWNVNREGIAACQPRSCGAGALQCVPRGAGRSGTLGKGRQGAARRPASRQPQAGLGRGDVCSLCGTAGLPEPAGPGSRKPGTGRVQWATSRAEQRTRAASQAST